MGNFKIVEDGRFKVYENGHVEKRDKQGDYVEAVLTTNRVGTKGRLRKELTTTYCEKGKQQLYYVKKLIASAFLPEREGGKFINYIDGDYTNIDSSNLVYITEDERIEKMLQTIQDNATPCICCGKRTINTAGLCPDCKEEKKREKALEISNEKKAVKIETLKKDFEQVNFNNLSDRDRTILEKRLEGCTLSDIGEEVNITREGVRRILKRIAENPEGVKRQPKESNKLKTKRKQLVKVNSTIEKLYAEIELNESKKQYIERYIENETAYMMTLGK